ncbi:MAG: hypothetical protein ACHQNA_13760, partial [Acidimicrobiales bacterium]
MSIRGRAALLAAGILLVSACTSGATPAPTSPPSAAPPSGSGSEAPASAAPATPIAGGLLDKVIKAGTLTVSTDPNYAPASV